MKHFAFVFFLSASQWVFGQFQPRTVIDSTATGITEIVTADVNSDGFVDLIVSQKFAQNNRIGYYSNQGNGSFGSQQVIADSINFPLDVATADFDGNGFTDIATFSGFVNSGELYLCLNNSGVFAPKLTIDANLYNTQQIEAADIDNDSDMDIVLIADTSLIVDYNSGSGNFTKNTIPKGIITEFYALEVNDIDGDGFQDVVCGGVKTLIYKNTSGTISFDSTRTAGIPDNNHLVFLVHLDDLDQDGDLDLVNDKTGSNEIRWYSNDGSGNFAAPSAIENNSQQCFSITSADFDDDGDVDLFTALPQLGQVVWYANDGSGNFSSRILIHQGGVTEPSEVCTDDLNNDGFPDIIWSQELSVHLNNSGGLTNEERSEEAQVTIYPNPTTNTLQIISPQANGILSIYTSSGKAVIINHPLSRGQNTVQLDVPAGVYLAVVQRAGKTTTHRVVVE